LKNKYYGKKDLIVKTRTTIDAPVHSVWDGLTNPDKIKKYMFGTSIISNWNDGSKIV